MNRYFYQTHHLIIASDISFPELKTVAFQPEDVWITEGPVPETLDYDNEVKRGNVFTNAIAYELSDNRLLFTITNVGKILITKDRSIMFERSEGVDYDTMRLYLLGTGLGFFLLWQGIFPFHGSTVETEYGAVMFIGESGEGKSTIAATFMVKGHGVLTDDVCVVRLEKDDMAWAYPSIGRIKLWDDSVSALGYDESKCIPIMPNWDKKQMSIPSKFSREPKPLAGIYKLSPDPNNQLKIEILSGQEKLMVLMNNTFRLMGVELFDKQKEHFNFCSAIAQILPVKLLKRPVKTFNIDTLYQLVMEDLKTVSFTDKQVAVS